MKPIVYLILLLVVSCSKEKSCENCIQKIYTVNGKINYSGPVGADGCDWLIRVNDSVYYRAALLDSAFMENDLSVQITYGITQDVFYCGFGNRAIPVIDIVSIKRI